MYKPLTDGNNNPEGSGNMKHMSIKEYAKYAESLTPGSSVGIKLIRAFVSGGLICVIGQAFLKLYLYGGFSREDASALTSVTLIFMGGLLTALDIYDDIAKFAGAGTLVPITGFSNSVIAPAIEFRSEGLVTGVGANMFKIAGPVLVYGIAASVICGILYYGGIIL